MILKKRRPLCECIRECTVNYKSPEIVEKVRKQMEEEGFSAEFIESQLANVRVLPEHSDF